MPRQKRRKRPKPEDLAELAWFACAIACPSALPPAPEEMREDVAELFAKLEELDSPLDARDTAGLLVLRLWSGFIPREPGRVLEALDGARAFLSALAHAGLLAPELMIAAGLAPCAEDLPPAGLEQVLPLVAEEKLRAAARNAIERYFEWCIVIDPRLEPADEHAKLLRGLARVLCYPPLGSTSDEIKAARAAARYFRRFEGKLVESEEILGALYRQEALADSGAMRISANGIPELRPEALRTIYRREARRERRQEELAEDLELLEVASKAREERDIAEDAEEAEALRSFARDEIDARILDEWGRSDVDIARAVGISKVAIGKRRKRLAEQIEKRNQN